MPPVTLFVSDTHWGHRATLGDHLGLNRSFATIKEHDKALIARWSVTVGPDDVVWHLGQYSTAAARMAVLSSRVRRSLCFVSRASDKAPGYLADRLVISRCAFGSAPEIRKAHLEFVQPGGMAVGEMAQGPKRRCSTAISQRRPCSHLSGA